MIKIFSDGGSRGNPGPGAIGVVIIESNQKEHLISEYIDTCTNNEAEYTAVVRGLEKLIDLSLTDEEILWKLDSELVVHQINGVYKIKKSELMILNKKIKNLIGEYNMKINFVHIPRSDNNRADSLVNNALDKELKTAKLMPVHSEGGYTFIEILIASIIFMSVITIASVGFAQVLKYRSLINAEISVNQVARTLTETINREVRQSAKNDIRVSDNLGIITSQNNVLLITIDSNNKWVKYYCDKSGLAPQVNCSDPSNSQSLRDAYLLIDTGSKIKVYEFKQGVGVYYQQFNEGQIISMNDLVVPSASRVSAISNVNVNVLFDAMMYVDPQIPTRLEYNLTVKTSNYNVSGVRAYERAYLNLQGAATVRNN